MTDASIYLMEAYSGENIVNVGTGIDVSIKELAELVLKIVGYMGALVFDASKPDGAPLKLME
ncbi:MAG: hypothetical protein V3V18_01480 [Methylococcales bacterium]